MSQTFFAILTAIGEAKLANATALGTAVQLTHMAVGDGNGAPVVPLRTQTTLVNERRRALINTLFIDPANASQIVSEQVIPEDIGGWWIREIGLFDIDGNLIAVANCPDTYKPVLAEGSGRTQVIRMVLIVANASAVQLKVDPAIVLATRGYADAKVVEHEAKADPHAQYLTAAEGNAAIAAAVAALVNSSPTTLDTLAELATALGNDANFAATLTNLLALKAPLASPALSGNPSAPTPEQFDNDTSLATTEFVNRALGNMSGQVGIVGAVILDATHAGKFLEASGASAYTITLPNANIVPGAVVAVQNIGSGVKTISRAGTNVIILGASTVNAIALNQGDGLLLVSSGGGQWYAINGSAALGAFGPFAASLVAAGYQRLPSGLIVQWGSFTSSNSADVAVTFPVAFPTACRHLALGAQCVSGLNSPGYNSLVAAGFSGNAWSSAATRSVTTVSYLAIGN